MPLPCLLTAPLTLTETETTVSAAVTVIPKDAIGSFPFNLLPYTSPQNLTSGLGHCISYNPVPVAPPIVTYYVETTLTDYSLTTVTTTSTTHIQAEVTAPAGCVREIGRSPQPALPGNGDELCKGIMVSLIQGFSLPLRPLSDDLRPVLTIRLAAQTRTADRTSHP